MNKIYELVLSAGPLEKIQKHRKPMRLMCQQTTECALFIREYASRSFSRHRSFLIFISLISYGPIAKRTITSPINGHDSKVTSYLDTFARLKDDFLTESAVVTEITVFQISAKTNELLSEMKEFSTLPLLSTGIPFLTDYFQLIYNI
jgi:hypothetical protein